MNRVNERNEQMIEWMNEWMNDCMNAWMHATNEWLNEWTICFEWMNEWLNEWRKEWMKEWTDEWMSGWMNPSMNEWMMYDCTNAWMYEGKNVCMYVRMYEWFTKVCVCVFYTHNGAFRWVDGNTHSYVASHRQHIEMLATSGSSPELSWCLRQRLKKKASRTYIWTSAPYRNPWRIP